jgi:ADP-ribose pyrophosphatase YjhB (NUDIX family)
MTATDPSAGVNFPRTRLEQRIRERRLTFEEFVAFAEGFARESGEDGTLSVRHLQRLVAGASTASRLRPATARLLERIFDEDVGSLLSAGSSAVQESLDVGSRPHALRVAIAVVMRANHVLLVRRREESEDLWQFPAGVVKPGAASNKVAASETLAETGVLCEPARMIGTRLHPRTKVYCDYFYCDYVAGEAMNLDRAENSGVIWAHCHAVASVISPNWIYPPVLDVLSVG